MIKCVLQQSRRFGQIPLVDVVARTAHDQVLSLSGETPGFRPLYQCDGYDTITSDRTRFVLPICIKKKKKKKLNQNGFPRKQCTLNIGDTNSFMKSLHFQSITI